MAESPCADDRERDAEYIETEQDEAGMMREKCRSQKDVDRKPAGAGHERNYQNCQQTALSRLDGPCRHNRRHIAAESHNHRDKRLSVQPHLVHHPVHNERRPRHISRILKQRNEKIEKQDVREENQHTAHSSYNSIHNQISQPPLSHKASDHLAEFVHAPLNPIHRIGSECERALEHNEQQHEENRECQPLVRNHRVNLLRKCLLLALLVVAFPCFGECALDERILRLHNSRLGRYAEHILQPLLLLEACRYDFVAFREGFHNLGDVAVVFEILNREVARRILLTDFVIFLKNQFDAVDALLKLRSVVDVDVTRKFRCVVFIDGDYRVEELFDSLARAADCRHNRKPEQIAQLLDVQLITACLELVIHVQRDHHPEVHVYDLCRQVEVPLKVRCIDDVDDHVRCLVYEVFPHIEFFGAVCGQRICARQIDECE